jgi:hypothetical protein
MGCPTGVPQPHEAFATEATESEGGRLAVGWRAVRRPSDPSRKRVPRLRKAGYVFLRGADMGSAVA